MLKQKAEEVLRSQIKDLVKDFARAKFADTLFLPDQTSIPVSGKVIDETELQFMVDAALDGWLTTGRFNEKFEKELSGFLGIRHLITTNSGSSANLIALNVLTSPTLGKRAIKPGDEVITVAAGFPTTVNPIVQFGAIPVFVDIDLDTLNVNAGLVEEAISNKTKAIMLAHTLGNPFDVEKIKKICDTYDLWLIEDCCDALGSKYKDKMVGTWGDIATLSFYPAHHITMGEGGAVFTNNSQLIKIAESFRDWGRDCYCKPGVDNTCGKRFSQEVAALPVGYDHKYIYSHLGYNLKITDMQAACGLAQLKKLVSFIRSRQENFNFLTRRLESIKDFVHFSQAQPHSTPAWFGFPMTLRSDCGATRRELLYYLEERKIGTRLLFAGNLIKQPYFLGREYGISGDLVNTDIVMNRTFWVGVFPGLAEQHLEHVASSLEEFFGVFD